MRETEAKKLKKLYKAVEAARGLSHPKLAKLMKTDKSQISHMMNGRNPINLERGLQFSRHIGCQLKDFSPRLDREANNIVQMIEGKVNGAIGDVGYLVGSDVSEIAEVLLNRTEVKNQIYWPGKHSAATYALAVEGESNAPELPHGSTAIVDTERELEVGKTVCLLDKDKVIFGKYQGDDFIELINPNYPDRVFKIKEKMSVLGVVIGTQIYK